MDVEVIAKFWGGDLVSVPGGIFNYKKNGRTHTLCKGQLIIPIWAKAREEDPELEARWKRWTADNGVCFNSDLEG